MDAGECIIAANASQVLPRCSLFLLCDIGTQNYACNNIRLFFMQLNVMTNHTPALCWKNHFSQHPIVQKDNLQIIYI